MAQTVVYEFHWTPQQVGVLFFDGMDYKGLRYWYEMIMKVNKPSKS